MITHVVIIGIHTFLLLTISPTSLFFSHYPSIL
nr:MAG TPA: hypothetical protein [Caudoviricetes sp.]